MEGPYRKETGIDVDYDSTGSTHGVKQMIDKTYTIGFTHTPMKEELRKKAKEAGGEVLHIPVVLCGVVPVYNVKELAGKPPLNFTADVLAKIFMGDVTTWDHEDLKKINPGVKLPPTKIVVVHRGDSSGTTFIFTDYLYGASELWQKKMGPPRNEIKWPVGVGMLRNNGVATRVPRTEGAIGYVDLLFAKARNLSYGAVENTDKTAFIHAEPENLTAAAQTMAGKVPDDLTFKLTNKPGKTTYPICGAVWAVCYQKQPAADQKMVVDFLHYITHEGQKLAKARTYAPLPDILVQRVDEKLKSITVQ